MSRTKGRDKVSKLSENEAGIGMPNTRVPRWVVFPLLGIGVLMVAVPSLLVYVPNTNIRRLVGSC